MGYMKELAIIADEIIEIDRECYNTLIYEVADPYLEVETGEERRAIAGYCAAVLIGIGRAVPDFFDLPKAAREIILEHFRAIGNDYLAGLLEYAGA